MNDLDLITELTPEALLPGPAELAPARERLTALIVAERAGERLPQRPAAAARHPRPGAGRPARWPARRPSRRLALTAAAAAVVAAGVTALVAVNSQGPSAPGVTSPPPSVAGPGPAPTGPPSTVKLAAARFLRQAAAAVREQPASGPRPGQFVYTETKAADGTEDRMWLSADGSRDGLVHNAKQRAFSVPPCTVAQAEIATEKLGKNLKVHMPFPCAGDEEAGYLPSMPTNPRALIAYLKSLGLTDTVPGASTGEQANDLGKSVDYLMQTTYLLPAQQAALFELMAQTPGFTVVHGARDAVGRLGAAIQWDFGGRAEIILNPRTYSYMGDRTWPDTDLKGCKDCQNMSKASLSAYDGEALVKMAFVNRAGQLP